MAAPKGNQYAKGGPGGRRKKGIPNRATIEFKEAVTNLINYATPQMVDWLASVEDPSKRLEHIYKFAQFGYPLLARTDVQTLDKDGKPADNQFTVRIIAGNSDNK